MANIKNSTVFLTDRSTFRNLLNCLKDWTLSVDKSETVHVIFLDFLKVFNRFLTKLETLEFVDPYYNGLKLSLPIKNFLLEWVQFCLTSTTFSPVWHKAQ